MRNISRVTVLTICLAIWAIPHRAMGENDQPAAGPQSDKVGQMNRAFAADLYAQLSPAKGNLFFSPTSIQTALAMTYAGAQGQTADEMARVLHLDPSDKAGVSLGGFLMALNDAGRTGGFELAVANALWGAKGYPFRPDYLAMVDKNFHGHLAELNFEVNPEGARKTINDWVAAQTHDRIKNLLPSGTIDPGTRLVLTNAIYFKGKWDLPFEARRTREDDFTSADGSKSKAAFMFQNAHFRYAEDDQVQVLELPYGKDALAMRIYLPKETDGLASFEKQMTAQKLADLGARLTSQDVDVWLPRFTMESEFSLADALKAMGMHAAFVPQQADFKGMTTAEQLYISAVIHKAFVKVDEEGTEAAAATAVVMRPMGVLRKPQPRQFRANHPFVFEIVDQKSAATLFMGRLATAPAGK